MASLFGNIDNPLKTINPAGYGGLGADQGSGLITFLSNVIKTITISAGLFAFINLIIAGFGYISAGSDAKKTAEAWARIYMSLIGLVIIASSYVLAAIFGTLFYGSPTAIINPQIYGPGAQQ